MDWFLYDNALRHERVNTEIYCNNNITCMKRGDKCLQDKQLAVVKATAAFAQISDKLLKAKG